MATLDAVRPAVPPTSRSWPVVRGHWLFGVMRRVQRDPLGLYRGAWAEHGDFVKLMAFRGFPFYLLAHPDAIEHVLHSNGRNYRKPDVFFNAMRPLAGFGLVTSEGELWRTQRRLMQPAFLKHQVARLAPRMAEATGRLIDRWMETTEHTFDVLPDMMGLALAIASITLFSADISAEADSIGRAYRSAFEYVSLRMNRRVWAPLWMPTSKNREFRQTKALLDRVILELIARRRGQAPQGDVMDVLLAAADEESGRGMSDAQLKDEAITLLTAGHETTGAALAWALYLLARHPEAQQELHDQVHARLNGNLPAVEDLASMPLATAVFEETMRLYPPAWGMPRESIGADEICGYPLPAKSLVIVSQDLAHRHPDFWTAPNEFNPQRFLPPGNAGRPKFAFFPFGGGPRICIGNHFAMIEGPLVLAALVDRFCFTLVEDHPVVPDPTFTLRPKYGIRLTACART